MKLLVIADDFTGSNDTGLQLAKKGAQVDVSFNWQAPGSEKADVVVINTESRAISQQDAELRVQQSIQAQKQQLTPDTIIYKKIDSTFRGNVGAEIASALANSNARLAIVAGAIPATGRVTRQGHCYVNNISLLDTEFATDPKTPIYSSSIKEIIARQTDLPIKEIHLASIRQNDPISLANELTHIANQEISIVVMDAETDNDLHCIGQSLLHLKQPFMLVGAAGLANALPESFYLEIKRTLPILVVAGSMSEVTRKQIDFAVQDNTLDIIDVDVERLLNAHRPQEIATVIKNAGQTLANQRHCVLRTCRDNLARETISHLCEQYQMTRQMIGDLISSALGEITKAILHNNRVGGLFLTGGDIAIAVARSLNAQGYRINAEVAPCIPCGIFLNSDVDDLPVITKAGGFGAETVLRDALYFIEEKYRDK